MTTQETPIDRRTMCDYCGEAMLESAGTYVEEGQPTAVPTPGTLSELVCRKCLDDGCYLGRGDV